MSDLAQLPERWRTRSRFFEALFKDLCEIVVRILRESTPGNTLPTKWTYEVTREGTAITATVWNTVLDENPDFERIMFYLDFGTSDHWIFPVNAQALSWVEDGVRYFSAGHRVSGIKASDFSAKATIAILEFTSTIQRKWTRYMNTGQLP